jgi:hypothetical protein
MQDDTGSSAMDVDRDQAEGKPDPMPVDSDARSDASFDPLFDDVPEELSKPQVNHLHKVLHHF